MPTATFRIDVHAKRARADVQAIARYYKAGGEFSDKMLDFVEVEGQNIMREEVPVGKSRQLLDNVNAVRTKETEVRIRTSGIGYRGQDYAPIIDRSGRTARSRGRYVKAIDRRLVKGKNIGWHRGAKGTPYSWRTARRLEKRIDEKLAAEAEMR